MSNVTLTFFVIAQAFINLALAGYLLRAIGWQNRMDRSLDDAGEDNGAPDTIDSWMHSMAQLPPGSPRRKAYVRRLRRAGVNI